MSLLVLGKTGQVALELAHLAPEATFLSRAEADLSDPARCAAAIDRHAPSAIINAAYAGLACGHHCVRGIFG